MRDTAPSWVFGYGSLIYRPAFAHRERRPGFVHHWSRQFWQASTDHRGTPEHPGRVATVTEAPGHVLWGMVYRLPEEGASDVMAALDHRERGGYQRFVVDATLDDGRRVDAVMYVAAADNPQFIGPAPLHDMARQVWSSRGPSGPNVEYVTRLAEALRDMGVTDDAAFDLEAEIQAMMTAAL